MIDEPELRELFAAEASSCLEGMERGLLALERDPGERPLLDTVFRQAHSLKGSAASLGLSAVESVAHQFEDALEAARSGRRPLTAQSADHLYHDLDTLRELVREALGAPPAVDETAALAWPVSPIPAADEASLTSSSDAFATLPVAAPARILADAASGSVRVATEWLDRALAEMGELVVTSARLGLRRAEAQQLRDLYESRARDWRLRGDSQGGDGELLSLFDSRLEALIRGLGDDQARLQQITEQLREEIHAVRLVPLSGLFHRFVRVVRDLARQEGKAITLLMEGEETTADKGLVERLSSPLTHLIRNAVDHGVEPPALRQAASKPAGATLHLSARRRGRLLEISLKDDGAGLNLQALSERALSLGLLTPEQVAQASEAEVRDLIFMPGFSIRTAVTALSGRGAGLDAVRTEVHSMGGSVGVESVPGKGSTFRMLVPTVVASSQVLVCSCGERLLALPLAFVERALLWEEGRTFWLGGRLCLEVDGSPVAVSPLDPLLGGRGSGGAICLILSDQAHRQAFLLDGLVGVMELVVKPFYESRMVSGAAVLPDGRVCLALQPAELLRLASLAVSSQPPGVKGWVLLAEDSPTVAVLARRVLSQAGYRITAATDGAEAWREACERRFDAVVSDVEMPNVDGLELTRRLRGLTDYGDVPILLVTSLTGEEPRLAGLEAGASAYLAKSSIRDGSLVRLLERLL